MGERSGLLLTKSETGIELSKSYVFTTLAVCQVAPTWWRKKFSFSVFNFSMKVFEDFLFWIHENNGTYCTSVQHFVGKFVCCCFEFWNKSNWSFKLLHSIKPWNYDMEGISVSNHFKFKFFRKKTIYFSNGFAFNN